jgi:predicted transcriptional regulator
LGKTLNLISTKLADKILTNASKAVELKKSFPSPFLEELKQLNVN